MLFKIAWKNMRKSIKDYTIYFFTIVIGVAIFYIFNSLGSQTVMMNVSADTREIIKMMTTIMSDHLCQSFSDEAPEQRVWNLSDSWHGKT